MAMSKKDYELITMSLARSKIAKSLDKNSVRRQAYESMSRLIAIDLAASLAQQDKRFKRDQFLKDCGVTE